jgi:hypothetical protein
MMARKPGGRKKVPANELKKLIAQLQASGDTTRLLEIMRDKAMPPKARLEAAKAALPFCHQPKDEIASYRNDCGLLRGCSFRAPSGCATVQASSAEYISRCRPSAYPPLYDSAFP